MRLNIVSKPLNQNKKIHPNHQNLSPNQFHIKRKKITMHKKNFYQKALTVKYSKISNHIRKILKKTSQTSKIESTKQFINTKILSKNLKMKLKNSKHDITLLDLFSKVHMTNT